MRRTCSQCARQDKHDVGQHVHPDGRAASPFAACCSREDRASRGRGRVHALPSSFKSAPAHFVATEAVAEPVIAPVAAEIMAEPVTPPAPASPAPRTISKVEYIRPPQVEYPALSRRIGEQGRVLLRVLIGREGRAERVEVQVSSGSQRLDDAAVKAAREALYRPYAENGVAISVWALVPTSFELS